MQQKFKREREEFFRRTIQNAYDGNGSVGRTSCRQQKARGLSLRAFRATDNARYQ